MAIRKGCCEVEGEYLHVLNEEAWAKNSYVAKSLYRKMFLGGFCRPGSKNIYIRESREYDGKLLCHERGHLRGLMHTWKLGYLMFPYSLGRGWKV